MHERLVDHVAAGDPDERDLRGLRADGEDDRDDEADAVRLQEAEQADEGRAIRERALTLGQRIDGCRRSSSAWTSERAGRAAPGSRARRPAARAGRMRERHDGHAVALEPLADRAVSWRAEQAAEREPADRDDQLRPQQLELPVAPELAELLLARRRRRGRRGRYGVRPG